MLRLRHLETALEHEDHLGWGYATKDSLPTVRQAKLDCAVIDVANELFLTPEDLFHWTNSKWGRWLVDGVYGRDESPTKKTVRNYLNEKAVREALDF